MNDFKNYLSPFSWRYGSPKMRQIFSEENKYRIWRQIWVALAKAQNKQGAVSSEELADLEQNQDNFSIERILEIESQTGHDVVAAIKEFAEKAKIGGGKIHLGATSMDINDNGEIIRFSQGLAEIEERLVNLLKKFSEKVSEYADTLTLAYTHLNPAEPTTLGYRFAFYAQDLLKDFSLLQFVKNHLKAKGMKGAVGTSASYAQILKDPDQMEEDVMTNLNLKADLISTQVYSRKTDYLILTVLNSIASSLAKFAADFRILQTPLYGEWSEPFGKNQVGSSAMPFKKNPVNSEKICGLARVLNQYPAIALENASLSHLERTLDDSASRRVVMPEAFLIVDEILETGDKLISGMVVNKERIKHNLNQYASFAATEKVIIEAVKNGANRQEMHELLREVSMQAWNEIQEGRENKLTQLILANPTITKYLSPEKISELMEVTGHLGSAPERARKLVEEIKKLLTSI